MIQTDGSRTLALVACTRCRRKEGVSMLEGAKCWYVVSLWEKAVAVTISRIERDLQGLPVWVVAEDESGNQISDYPTKFTIGRTIRYR